MTGKIPKNHDCPFCRDEFAGKAFMQNADFLAVYNIAPILPGHSLIIPKRHIESLTELSDKMVAMLFVFARQATSILMKAFHGEAFDWSLQDGKPAGQTVPHLHLHIIVRKQGDLTNPGDWYPSIEKANDTLLDSFNRNPLDNEAYLRITEHLRTLALNSET